MACDSGTRFYTCCAIEGPNLIVVRRCATCGAFPRYAHGRVQGQLPDKCRNLHGNFSIEIHVEVPNA